MEDDAGKRDRARTRSAGVPPRITASLRAVVGVAVVLTALRFFLPPRPIEDIGVGVFWAWLALAGAIGSVLARRWALLLAPLPLVAQWYTVATGPEYLTYGDHVPLLWETVIIAIGLAGIALGIGAGRSLTGGVAVALSVPRRTAECLILLALLILVLGAAVLDVSRGGRFLSVPHPIEPRRYSEEDVRVATAALGYAVYAASGEGAPNAALRSTSAPPGLGPTETFTLIYCDERCRRSSKVQILSAPPEYGLAARQRGGTASKPLPIPQIEPVEIAGVIWQIEGTGPRAGTVTADAILGDAYVQISAPDRAHFERVAASLRRINR